MGRLKNGSKIAHFNISNVEQNSTWIGKHYNGLLDNETDTEITTIPFVGDESPNPLATPGEFKSS